MKNIILVIFLIFVYYDISAQDLIVTSEGDSLNCKITNIDKDYIHFIFKYKDEIRNTLLPVNQVTFYKYNYFSKTDIPTDYKDRNRYYPYRSMALNFGWSYRTAKLAEDMPAELKEYNRGLFTGGNIGLEICHYFSQKHGLGLKLLGSGAGNSVDDFLFTLPDNSTQRGHRSDFTWIGFVGPCYSLRLYDGKKKNCFLMNLSVGYIKYNDYILEDNFISGSSSTNNFTKEGNTFGIVGELEYDFAINKYFALGCQVSYLWGSLSEYTIAEKFQNKIITLPFSTNESLQRLDFSIILKANRFE